MSGFVLPDTSTVSLSKGSTAITVAGANWALAGVTAPATLRVHGREVTVSSAPTTGAPQLKFAWPDDDVVAAPYEVFPVLDALTFSADAKQFIAFAQQMMPSGRLIDVNGQPLSADCYIGIRVKSFGAVTPPDNPAIFDMYYLGATPTGVWADNGGTIAVLAAEGWRFYAPWNGLGVKRDGSTSEFIYTDGAWIERGTADVVNMDAERARAEAAESANAGAITAEATARATAVANESSRAITKEQEIYGTPGSLFDPTSLRYMYGKSIYAGLMGASLGMGWALTADGYFYSKPAIRCGSAANGLTWSLASDGFYEINFGSVGGKFPIDAGGDVFDTTAPRYAFGKKVWAGLSDAGYRQGWIVSDDGYFFAKYALQIGTANGLSLTRNASTGFYTFSLGSSESILPLGSGGDGIESSTLRYYGTKKVIGALTDSSYRAGWIVTDDGTTYIPKLVAGNVTTPGLIPSTSIYCAGDSLSNGTGGTPYPTQLATMLGRTVVNSGIGGQTSTQIAARQGGNVILLTVFGNVISSGSNSVTTISGVAVTGSASITNPNNQLLSTGADNTTRTATGTLGSVHGTLTRTATGGPPSTAEVYTFTPDSGSSLPANCPAGTPFIVDTGGYDTYTCAFWVGRNDYSAQSEIVAAVNQMVSRLSTAQKRFVIMSIINGVYSYETQGNTGYTQIVQANAAIQQLYPANYLDVRRLLIDQGLTVAGITPTVFDTADIANDTVPTSLHPTAKTATLSVGIGAADVNFGLAFTTGSLSSGDILYVNSERILVTAISGSTVTNCVRGYMGTTAASHSLGAAVTTIDQTHLNTSGYLAVATFVKNFITAKGW